MEITLVSRPKNETKILERAQTPSPWEGDSGHPSA